jgi:16S rRNA (guanine527-N7)-methyltransferase
MERIRKYFSELSPAQLMQFEKLGQIYTSWNRKINVISRKDIYYFYERHLLHSLAIAKVFRFPADSRILDVGTGGGLPGIPLAIFFPECSFMLIDSIGKKIQVTRAIAEEIELKNVSALQTRIENYDEKFHYIVARAVTDLRKFMTWVTKNIDRKNLKDPVNGVIYLKGGNLEEEIRPFPGARIINIADFFEEEYFLTKKMIYLGIHIK